MANVHVVLHLLANALGKCQFSVDIDLKKKNAQHGELHFIGAKMRAAAQEIAPQIALRNCSKNPVGEISICVILVKGECRQ